MVARVIRAASGSLWEEMEGNMAQVWVTEEKTARRCQEAVQDGTRITFTELVGHEIKPVAGRVQSVEEDRGGPEKRWRVTIIE